MTELRVTGPNGDGEYWLHIKAGGKMGGVNLGAAHGPLVQRLLDAAALEAQPAQEPVAHWYTGPTEEQATAALRAKLAEMTRKANGLLLQKIEAEADRDEERKLADEAVAALKLAGFTFKADRGFSNATIARHAARRKEQG